MPRKEKTSHVVTFTLPAELKDILDSVLSTGYYDSLSEFIRDSIRTHIRNHRELDTLITFHRYKAKKISIGKASAILGSSLQETKELFEALET